MAPKTQVLFWFFGFFFFQLYAGKCLRLLTSGGNQELDHKGRNTEEEIKIEN